MKNTANIIEADRVPVAVPRGGAGEDPNLFVSVGGVNYLLPRGETSLVPPAVAAEIARAERARDHLDRRVRELAGV